MEDLRYLKQEMVVVILLDVKNEIIKTVTVAIGGLSQSGVEAREIFKEPIKNSASSIILAHNHPSGDPSPSDSDIVFTKRIYDAGKIFGIEVLDHIIIGNGIRGSGDTKWMLYSQIIGSILVVSCSFVLVKVFNLGIAAIYITLFLDESIRASINGIYYKIKYSTPNTRHTKSLVNPTLSISEN